eukprot:scaffold3504_cov240-Pinguiococcus_pyrenoidosus.AAC.28
MRGVTIYEDSFARGSARENRRFFAADDGPKHHNHAEDRAAKPLTSVHHPFDDHGRDARRKLGRSTAKERKSR